MKYGGRRRVALVGAATLVALTGVTATGTASAGHSGGGVKRDKPAFTLTILHNNDGESSLLPTVVDLDPSAEGEDLAEYGGIARFQRKVDVLRWKSGWATYDRGEARRRGAVLLNSGDNFLAGTTFQASQQDGAPFYDGLAVRYLNYDALAIGNHEFDFGPPTLARFIDTVGRKTPFVSANLDVSADPSLAPFEGDQLVKSTVIRERGERIGVVGLTTPLLSTISSPGAVVSLPDIAAIAQAEIDALTARRINKIVLVSHLQGLDEELALVSQLRGVDVVIGGGGDEVLGDPDDEYFPGQEDDIVGTYPLVRQDADGRDVPVVTTPGNYRYVGMLQVTFDKKGNVLSWDEDDSGIKLVTDRGPEAVGVDKRQLRNVQQPVAEFVDGLAEIVIGGTEVILDCERPEVRTMETNCGNLVADALLSTGQQLAAGQGLDTPQVGIINGGGIRVEGDVPVGPLSVADTFRVSPFGNFVSVAEDVPAETLRQIVEEGVSAYPGADGGFAHLAGATVVIDPTQPARQTTPTGEQVAPGSRVRSLVLSDGTVVVENGVSTGVTVDVVGLNFSLNGGDAYPAVPNTSLGISDQQALQTYIEDTLGGVITEAQYPRGGEGRITFAAAP